MGNLEKQSGLICRVTCPPKHHLFGFHDLVQTNAKGDLLLALEVDDISHPPCPNDVAQSGVVELDGGLFRSIHQTRAFNYPQGARQQWIGATDNYLCNDRDLNGQLICRISNARELRVVDKLPFPVHCLAAHAGDAYFMDYDRIHQVGGYGYVGGTPGNLEDLPTSTGIFKGSLTTTASDLLVSLFEIAANGETSPRRTGYPHYVTHLLPNPSQNRLAFLHRYRVPDGGEITRLMTIGTDGSGLRCLGKGFLSHFDWLDDAHLFIWGKDERSLCAFREAPYLRMPGVLQAAMVAKRVMRLLRQKHAARTPLTGTEQNKSFLIVSDEQDAPGEKTAIGILTEDGHPMVNPLDRDWLVNDTYPDASGKRTLMLYHWRTGRRIDLGRFAMMQATPDTSAFDASLCMQNLDQRVRRKFARELYLFTRSGYHCDLHPRWGADGKTIFFDSIHEGSRQIYQARFDAASLVQLQ